MSKWDFQHYSRFKNKSKSEKCGLICDLLGIDERNATLSNPSGGFSTEGLTKIILELEKSECFSNQNRDYNAD